MKHVLVIGVLLASLVFRLPAQPFVDPCFTSPSIGTTFAATTNVRNNNSDLLNWTGSNWTGGWPGANITLAPPGGVAGTRAIWSGDGTVWTTGGEGFGLRLASAVVAGTTYTFSFRRVSHGTGQNGNFRPVLYTNTGGSFGTSYGNIATVGTAWANPNITFTAVAGSAGHTYVYFHNSVGSGMFMGCLTTVLPMAFSGLEAYGSADAVHLEWNVQDEEEYLWHVVERSLNGVEFENIGQEKSVQAGAEGHLYRHQDNSAAEFAGQRLYYRIQSVDMEGKSAYSPVVEVDMTHLGELTLQFFPNPARVSDDVNIRFYSPMSMTGRIEIIDLQGRTVFNQVISLEEGSNNLAVSTQDIQPGMYWAFVKADGVRARTNFVVQ